MRRKVADPNQMSLLDLLTAAGRWAGREERREAARRGDEAWAAARREAAVMARRHGWDVDMAMEIAGEIAAGALRTWRADGGASVATHVKRRVGVELGRRMAVEMAAAPASRVVAGRVRRARELAGAAGRLAVEPADAWQACLDDGLADVTAEQVEQVLAADLAAGPAQALDDELADRIAAVEAADELWPAEADPRIAAVEAAVARLTPVTARQLREVRAGLRAGLDPNALAELHQALAAGGMAQAG